MNSAELGPLIEIMVNWLLTYWLHSSVLLGITWLVVRFVRTLDPAAVEMMWRVALFAGIISATVYCGLGIEPLAGRLVLSGESAPSTTAGLTTAGLTTVPPASVVASSTFEGAALHAPWLPTAEPEVLWPFALVVFWLAAASFGLVRLGRSIFRLRQLLSRRRAMPAGRSIRRLAEQLGIRSPVRLSLLDGIRVPFASGILHPEICVPRLLAASLNPEELDIVLAHEMAHVARRDPAWQLLYRGLSAVLPQPLNTVGRHHLEFVAELRADDLATGCAGRRRALARSLVATAAQAGCGLESFPVAAAVSRPGTLSERVERLLIPRRSSSTSSRILAGLATGMVAGVLVLIPAVSLTPEAQAKVFDHQEGRMWSNAVDSDLAQDADSKPRQAPDEEDPGNPPVAAPAVRPDAAETPETSVQMQILREQVDELRRQLAIERSRTIDEQVIDFEGGNSEEIDRIRAEVTANIRRMMAIAEEKRVRAESRISQRESEKQAAHERARIRAEEVQEIDRQHLEEVRERILRERERAQKEVDRQRERAEENAARRENADAQREKARRIEAEVRAAIEAEKRENQKREAPGKDGDTR